MSGKYLKIIISVRKKGYEKEYKNGKISCDRGITGKSKDNKKIPWEEL